MEDLDVEKFTIVQRDWTRFGTPVVGRVTVERIFLLSKSR